jgi:hypothetical protein
MALYDKRSSEFDSYKYKVEDSFPEYMNADRKWKILWHLFI